MPVWCPKCHAMLAEGLEECPRCGAFLSESAGPSDRKAVFWMSAYTIGIALITIVAGVAIAALCIFLFLSR